jgi:hypothetical protein
MNAPHGEAQREAERGRPIARSDTGRAPFRLTSCRPRREGACEAPVDRCAPSVQARAS